VIKRSINKKNKIFLYFLIAIQQLSAQIVSPFNKLNVSDTSQIYSFIVSGHFHGASSNISTYPASSLLANIDTLNSLQPSFLMSLGDLFLDVNEINILHYQKSLFNKLKMPLFNAVGNHDLSGNLYEKVFDPTFFKIIINSELFIVLNTEVNDGSIKGEQLEFLKNTLFPDSLQGIKNIFIFSHRPVWAESIVKYKNLFQGNTRTILGNNNFPEIISLFQPISKSKNVYWISGSMGGGPSSFFYDRNDSVNITFMQTAIRDLPRDAVLLVTVNNGNILLKGVSLTDEVLKPIEQYNIDYWNKTIPPEQHFNFRLLPYLTIQIISHKDFWIGVFLTVLSFVVFLYIRRRWKKRK
jgi:hypothetical protein